MLNIAKAWQYSTGNGVPVAVIDTGVNPSHRLPVVPGGDYIMGGDGLMDCDAHGTVVASVIAAAPQGAPMPAPMPAAPAFPPPAGPPATDAAPPPPGGPPAPLAPPPPPSPVTITETKPAPPPPPPPPPPDEPSNGPGDPVANMPDDPEVPPPPPGAPDGVGGVAPHATIISIRQSSRAFEPERPGGGDMEARKKAGTVATLASAIVHAANMGAKVINVSVTACVSADDPLDQSAIGAAVWYAATVKDAVIVAAAGNEGEDECAQNPAFDPLDAADPRDWHQVKTVSSPSWFSDYVLSVGAVDNTGAPIKKSLAGTLGSRRGSRRRNHGTVSADRWTGERLSADPAGREEHSVLGNQFFGGLCQRRGRAGAREVPGVDRPSGHQPDSADSAQPAARCR